MRTLRELIDRYFSKRTFPYWCLLLLDSLVLLFTSIFIYWCFNRGAALQRDFWPLLRFLSLSLCVHMVFFASFRTYSGIIRYSSFSDLPRVAYAMGCSCLAVIILHVFTNRVPSDIGEDLPAGSRMMQMI